VQDTWIAVIKGIDGFEGRSSLRMIFRILANQAAPVAPASGARCRRRRWPTSWRGGAASVSVERFAGPPGRGMWGPAAGVLERPARGAVVDQRNVRAVRRDGDDTAREPAPGPGPARRRGLDVRGGV
jgi:RNA polymerase sigma-70 factor (ECF subfamily)